MEAPLGILLVIISVLEIVGFIRVVSANTRG